MPNPPPLPSEPERNRQVPPPPLAIPRVSGNTATPQKTRIHFIPKLIIALVVAFGAFIAFRVVQTIQYFRTHPLKHPPGSDELLKATTLVTGSRRGVAHGNSPEAVELAAQMSAALKEIRENLFSAGNKDSLDIQMITKGEFIGFCQKNEETCAFIVHVPELKRFTSDAKATMARATYLTACRILPREYKQRLRKLGIATRGTLMFSNALIGESGFDGEDPTQQVVAIQPKGTHLQEFQEFFAEQSTGK